MTPLSYLLQRGTAMILVPLVVTHLVLIIVSAQGGITGEEILARTRGNFAWAAFYGLFVIAAAIHAGIGLQAILREWSKLSPRLVAIASHGFMALLIVLGLRAVYAVIA